MTEGVIRPSWTAGRAQKALPEGQEGSESTSGKLGGVGRDRDFTQEGQNNWQGWEALPKGQEALGGPFRVLCGVRMASRKDCRDLEALPEGGPP